MNTKRMLLKSFAFAMTAYMLLLTITASASMLDPSWPYDDNPKLFKLMLDQHFKSGDTDKDGKLSQEEFGKQFTKISRMAGAAAASAGRGDKPDQKVEATKTAKEFFTDADKDKSGSLSKDEFDKVFLAVAVQEKKRHAHPKKEAPKAPKKPLKIERLPLVGLNQG